MSCIILLGIKHCGKSTQARLIANTKQIPFYDTDDLITEKTGKTPREIYKTLGEQGFMDAERDVCISLAKDLQGKEAVIATGGGICKNKEALDALHKIGKFVFLNAREEQAADRIIKEVVVNSDKTLSNLPAYIAKKNPATIEDVRIIFHDFYTERVSIYSSIADIEVQMLNATKEENAQQIINSLS